MRCVSRAGGLDGDGPGWRGARLWGDRLDVLVTLVEAYERERHPMEPPDPIDAIRFRLEQMGQDQRVLIGVIGSRSRVHEVMNGDRGAVPGNDSPTQREVRHSRRSPDPADAEA